MEHVCLCLDNWASEFVCSLPIFSLSSFSLCARFSAKFSQHPALRPFVFGAGSSASKGQKKKAKKKTKKQQKSAASSSADASSSSPPSGSPSAAAASAVPVTMRDRFWTLSQEEVLSFPVAVIRVLQNELGLLSAIPS